MAERDIGTEILEGIREIKAHKAGKVKLHTRELKDPSSAQDIRKKLGLSQEAFAGLIGVSIRTLQDWEQGRRKPTGPAKALLRIVEKHPEVLLDEAS
ncbi:MAG: type II toxin-antitoxin system MqsA family antitoxin [Gammaproteobacteria bacterium]|jgi:putative transcriptional regulator|nr:type II toxin-antitoxin system MqsA family antitoxin [Gammaproteobacteria bacterium]MCW8957861.1 type II toxin-antitoxin system MqsA family antitoxin [Gammaproteobacteria bacterium]MCW8972171.1 type II toxin-antitoxin system MqsA family antitoxin [Gammaproteobacteria bacterium]MCW8991821.1 type II toxin-antitoxin system MqsA family antitoxin [Gammaproteobacteria bacterium]